MHSLNHEHLANAIATARERPGHEHVLRAEPPPGRLRMQAATALATLASRLDRDQARRVVA